MKLRSVTLSSWFLAFLLGGWACTRLQAVPASAAEGAKTVQAIEQAPDPSSVVSAYANGFALNRHNPQFYTAYVARMVELDAPKLAYDQARILTALDPRNGLAWGVIAWNDGRRGDMAGAISAINQAGRFAPDNPFVERAAGGTIAWYDAKADKAQWPESVKAGLARTRSLLEPHATFRQEYDSIRHFYEVQANAQPARGH